MDPLGTATKAVDLLCKVIEFYRGYKGVPHDINDSLDRSLRSSELLKMWMNVFERLERDSIPESFAANLMITLRRLKRALDTHRGELEEWMLEMGFPKVIIEDNNETNHPHPPVSEPPSLQKKSSLSHLKAPLLKTLFVLMGAGTLKSLEKKIKDSEREVMNVYLTLVPHATFKRFGPGSIGASIEPPIVKFLSKAKERRELSIPVNILTEEEWINLSPTDHQVVDENMAVAQQIHLYTIPPNSVSTGIATSKQQFAGKYVCYGRSIDSNEEESLNLARLFAVDGELESGPNQLDTFKGDGDMLSCSAVVKTKSSLLYVFESPQGSTDVRSLRSLLLDKGACPEGQNIPFHSIVDRIKFSIRLATSVLVVHSLGLVHKRIRPETILVVDTDGAGEFPDTLGYPYLVGFYLSRSDKGHTSLIQDLDEIRTRGIYIHPREQAEARSNPYLMISDIYSLGVCLFEVALWRSLFIVDPAKGVYTVCDTSGGFEKLADASYEKGMKRSKKTRAKTNELIRIAKREIPRTMGRTFSDVVVACLCAGDLGSPFEDHGELKGGGNDDGGNSVGQYENVSVKYLELVLKNLHAVYEGVSGNH